MEDLGKTEKVLVIPAQPIFFNFFKIKKDTSFSTFSVITYAVA